LVVLLAGASGIGSVGILGVVTPSIVLYGPRMMTLTEKVGRALRVKQLAFAVVEPASPEDYQRLSPETGLLPVLEVDGARIPDSTAILDFLDHRFPEPPLVSSDARVAREQRRLEQWIDQTLAFYVLRWVRARIGPDVPLPVAGGGFPAGAMARLGLLDDGKIHAEVFDPSGAGPGPEFARRLDDLEQMLGSRRYFYADRISRADLSVCASLSVMYRDAYPGARALLAARKALFDHVERVQIETGGAEPV
jgi:glutathione S-transferase